MKNLRITYFFLLCSYLAFPLYAQKSMMEQFMAEHHLGMLTADSIDPNHDDLVITALAMQQLTMTNQLAHEARPEPSSKPAPQPYVLQIDTASDCAELLAMNGQHLADVHFMLVDSTWYMWLSVDPLADQNIQNSPYMYCNGNPIMLVDPDGMKPSDEEAAAMAAYGDIDLAAKDEKSKAIRRQLGDWEPIRTDEPKLTGYRAVLFEREVEGNKEYAYAFAGTDAKSIADITTDIAQAIDLPSQYEIAVAYARLLAIKYLGSELAMVGHSLGGGMATAAALATGKTAITFNPAAVSRSTVMRNFLFFPAKIENHVVEGDPLTIGQKLGNPLLRGGI